MRGLYYHDSAPSCPAVDAHVEASLMKEHHIGDQLLQKISHMLPCVEVSVPKLTIGPSVSPGPAPIPERMQAPKKEL
jgi:hypothetical protein